jgi:hypothetical protein
LVECDANKVVAADKAKIIDAFAWAMDPLTTANQLYGYGDASDRIVKDLLTSKYTYE